MIIGATTNLRILCCTVSVGVTQSKVSAGCHIERILAFDVLDGLDAAPMFCNGLLRIRTVDTMLLPAFNPPY